MSILRIALRRKRSLVLGCLGMTLLHFFIGVVTVSHLQAESTPFQPASNTLLRSKVATGLAREQSTVTKNKIQVVHVVNLYAVASSAFSPLNQAQNTTIASMIRASKNIDKNAIDLVLVGSIFPKEESYIVPVKDFEVLVLPRSTRTVYPDLLPPRDLPFVQDIFQSTLNSYPNLDYLIFTNSDIGLHDDFYKVVSRIIHTKRYTAFAINRRALPTTRLHHGDKQERPLDGTQADLDYIMSVYPSGGEHPGKDCFVMHRNVVRNLDLGYMFVGFPPWGRALDRILSSQPDIRYHSYMSNDWNATFHLGAGDGDWDEQKHGTGSGSDMVLLTMNRQRKRQIQSCAPIQWKLRHIKTMSTYRFQNTKNCASVFEHRENSQN